MKRRHFLETLGAAGVLFGASPWLSCSGQKKPLRILVLGGTSFLGPAIVKAGLDSGHEITLFNRGLTNPELFPELPLVRGDREKGPAAYDPLKKTSWDVVIDVWPQQSKLVEEASLALLPHANHYVFISSVAVYKDFNEAHRAENYPMVSLPEDKATWGYAEEKAAAEAIVTKRFPENHTILRPGPIKGWRDPAYDLLYWLIKLDRDESILAPGDGSDPLQFIDVKDVGRFAVKAAEQQSTGIFNCVGPGPETLTWKQFLETAKEYLKSDSELYWSSQDFLYNNKVYAWEDLPLWAPVSDDYFMQVGNAKSVAAGFTFSPLEKTIRDCLDWHRQYGKPNLVLGKSKGSVGLERSQELEVISRLQGG